MENNNNKKVGFKELLNIEFGALRNQIEALETSLNTRIDDMKFVVSNIKEDVQSDIKNTHKKLDETADEFNLYATNHEITHQKIEKIRFKLIIVLAIVAAISSVANPYILPLVLKFLFGIII